LPWPLARLLPLPPPGAGSDSIFESVAADEEASIPRSLACSAAAVEEELPGAGGAAGVGAEVVAFGGVTTGFGAGAGSLPLPLG
jgi:hypothetical protein